MIIFMNVENLVPVIRDNHRGVIAEGEVDKIALSADFDAFYL